MRDEPDPKDLKTQGSEHPAAIPPMDAAESLWDPWLWALYLRELAGERALLH